MPKHFYHMKPFPVLIRCSIIRQAFLPGRRRGPASARQTPKGDECTVPFKVAKPRFLEFGVTLQVLLERCHEARRGAVGLRALLLQVAQSQRDVRVKRNCAQLRTVGDAHQDAGGDRVAVERHDQLGEAGAVGGGDGLGARLVAQRLLEEGCRSVFALVKVDVGVIGKLLERCWTR